MCNTLRETNVVLTKLKKEKPLFCRDLHSKDLKMYKLDTHIILCQWYFTRCEIGSSYPFLFRRSFPRFNVTSLIMYENILAVSFNLVLVALMYDPKSAQFSML